MNDATERPHQATNHEQAASQAETNMELRKLEHMLQKLWDARTADVEQAAGLAGRIDKIEAGFEAVWNILTRLEVGLADITRSMDARTARPPHHDSTRPAAGVGTSGPTAQPNFRDRSPDRGADAASFDGPRLDASYPPGTGIGSRSTLEKGNRE